jgi:hypothetical protein
MCDPGYIASEAEPPIFNGMSRRIIFGMGIPLLGILLLPACLWDNVEEIYPDTPNCDTLSVSFSNDLVPILSNNCFSCHSGVNAPSFGGGLSFEDHSDVAGYSDRIIGAINHEPGFNAMPKVGDKLDPCSILKFEAWAQAGTPDN